MPVIVIVGAQWGDEGKGKVVDHLAQSVDVVLRFGGGANAGHTLVVNGKPVTLRLLPSGILYPKKLNIVGPYVVCDPEVLVRELRISKEAGSAVLLDNDAMVVLPLFKQIDEGRENERGCHAIGTTKNGIGPCYESHKARREFRLRDLESEQAIRRALDRGNLYADLAGEVRFGGDEPMDFDEIVAWAKKFSGLKEYLGDTREMVEELLEKPGCNILAEGAQGIMLDEDQGSRPDNTASNSTQAGFSKSFGIYPPVLKHTAGIAKAYVTRVGGGVMPSEMDNEWSRLMQDRGKEFGSVTGRPRRVGALDLPLLRFACRRGGLNSLIITKLDLLSGLHSIPVCVGYLYKSTGLRVPTFATLSSNETLANIKPQFIEVDSWSQPIDKCRCYDDLPAAAQAYINLIENSVGKPVIGVGVGPERDAIIWRNTHPLF